MLAENSLLLSLSQGFIELKQLSVGECVMASDGNWHKIMKLEPVRDAYANKLIKFTTGDTILVNDNNTLDIVLAPNMSSPVEIKKMSEDSVQHYLVDIFKGYGTLSEKVVSGTKYDDLYDLGYRHKLPKDAHKLSLIERRNILAGIVDSYNCTIYNGEFAKLVIPARERVDGFIENVISLIVSLGFRVEILKHNTYLALKIYKTNGLIFLPTRVLQNQLFVIDYKNSYNKIIDLRDWILTPMYELELDSGACPVVGHGMIKIGTKKEEE